MTAERLPQWLDKCACSKCGKQTFRIASIGFRVVCPDCFAAHVKRVIEWEGSHDR